MIKAQLKDFAYKTDFINLEDRIMPPVNKAKLQITEFKAQLSQHSEMIRRFDEVICEKVSVGPS